LVLLKNDQPIKRWTADKTCPVLLKNPE